jgi:alpha-glucoside transport system substrate-binding protein
LSFDRDPVTRGPTVEISHEALLTEWTRLHQWIEAARDDVRNQRRLALAMREWQTNDRRDEYLLQGGRLEQLHGWAQTTTLTLSTPEREFLDASVDARTRAAQDVAEREQRVAHAEREAHRRVRQLVGVGVLGVVVAGLAVFGIWQWLVASDARDEASDARVLAEASLDDAEAARVDAEAARDANQSLVVAEQFRTASDAALTRDPELALLFAVEAVRSSAELGYATEESIDSLHWALQRLGVQYPVGGDARSTIRSGPTGLTGVFLLPPAELIALAENSTERRLTDEECLLGSDSGCPERVEIDADLPLRFDEENYVVEVPEVLPGVPAFGTGPLAGTRVTLGVASNIGRNDGLRAELDRFTDVSGIEVALVTNTDFDITRLITTGGLASTPDIVGFFSPPPPWAQPRAIDLGEFLDVESLRSDFGDYLVDVASNDDGELHGVVMNTFPDGMVFYPKQRFEAAGYEVPTTWDELVDLSRRLVADGETPWCFNWEAGFASGFAGSDFLESLVLRVGGVDAYDAWVSGEASFDSFAVVEAARLGEELLFSPGFVAGGPESISSEPWQLVALSLLDENPLTGDDGPECWFVHQSSQMIDILGPAENPVSGRLGEDVDYFMLPPLDGGTPAPVNSGVLLGTAMTDRPEIRALMNYIASPSWGEVMAGMDTLGETFFSSNRRFDSASYMGERAQPNFDVRLRLHQENRAAIEAGTYRLDASDLMPLEFSTWTNEYAPGPFWQGMIDWVDRVKPIEEILADIQTAREAFDADSGG